MSPPYLTTTSRHAGSGFMLEGSIIMTNFHVIKDAIDIRIRKHGVSRRWRGTVIASGPDVDLALLKIHEEEEGKGDDFWLDAAPAPWADDLPALQSAVSVIGFPTGGTTISVTSGVVSRVDCKNYRIGVTTAFNPGGMLVLQIDAAINAGNSGGPAFSADGKVVGVAFQSLGGNADGIGYLIPALVARNFLHATDGGAKAYEGVVDVPFRCDDLLNSSLR